VQGRKSDSSKVAEQVFRYVKPCFMRWFLTAEEGILGRTARAGLDACCCRADYVMKGQV
jgi:hypothetical protein